MWISPARTHRWPATRLIRPPSAATEIRPGNCRWYSGPVAVAYNLDGVKQLVVNADVLAKIFTGWITNWNDPAIVKLNPGVALPDTRIAPIYRSDSSGTTDNFQKYLATAAPNSWTRGTGSEFQGGVGEGAQKSAGVIQAVQSTPGAIGYVEKGFADQSGVPIRADQRRKRRGRRSPTTRLARPSTMPPSRPRATT